VLDHRQGAPAAGPDDLPEVSGADAPAADPAARAGHGAEHSGGVLAAAQRVVRGVVPGLQLVPGAGPLHRQAGLPHRPRGSRGPLPADREAPVREIYILATVSDAPVSVEEIRSSFESEDVKVTLQDDGRSFVLSAEEVELTVRFESRQEPLGWS